MVRETACKRLGLEDRLGQKGNQPITAAFRRDLQFNDILPPARIDDKIGLHVADA